ncbi:unnamed protein product, partial [Polarella glacialis]
VLRARQYRGQQELSGLWSRPGPLRGAQSRPCTDGARLLPRHAALRGRAERGTLELVPQTRVPKRGVA